MKSVLISIHPKWCELIASGQKIIEIRKTRPKIETPFKCYICCTKADLPFSLVTHDTKDFTCGKSYRYSSGGEVIGEFVCKKVDCMAYCGTDNNNISLNIVESGFQIKSILTEYLTSCQLSRAELLQYSNHNKVYGWQISELVIYNEPKELSRFRHCGDNYHFNPILSRPPQSWTYVEETV